MTDRELERRLRAFYDEEVDGSARVPDDLRMAVHAIPSTSPVPLRPPSRRRGFTLLAVAAVLLVGGMLAAGSGVIRPNPKTTPPPRAVVEPTGSPVRETAAPAANVRPGAVIAYIRSVDKGRTCLSGRACTSNRLWIVGTYGGARELFPEGDSNQFDPIWSPDGNRLLFWDDRKLYVTDASGREPQSVDTGCSAGCQGDSQLTFSSDGKSVAFIRLSTDPAGYAGSPMIATMELATGRVVELSSTLSEGTAAPAWSPDGKQIVFFQYGEKDTGGPTPPRLSALWLVDPDGQNLRQLTPATVDAANPEWSPDGRTILFIPSGPDPQDIYTIRPDGSDLRRLTRDGLSTSATWTADGRILFVRGGSAGSAGWWTMDADGRNASRLLPIDEIGAEVEDLAYTRPAWQPLGGAAIVPPPWTPAPPVAVGPPAPTPIPTRTPDLSPGFSWAGAVTAHEDGPLAESAILLADGRVLMAGGCGTATEVYDPATGAFTSSGVMTAVRGGGAATMLRDGRVLFSGGYNCGAAGEDGIWASAELFDPATGTFSPTGSMAAPRSQHTSTLLDDGRVLITGGLSGSSPPTGGAITLAGYRTVEVDSFLATAEIYDPTTGTFGKTGSMSGPHRGHTATLLADGRVLVIGNGGETSAAGTAADVYDPATGTFSRTGSMKYGRWLHTATLLADGRVLILGGRTAKDSVRATAELYDPGSGRFSSAGSMRDGRQQHTATRLPDGRVFIAGGYWSDGQSWRVLSSTEMYDPASGQFREVGSMGTARQGHGAVLLGDGRVLIVGGEELGNNGATGVSRAVLYQP
jgi:Tol biopolymer transport system component